MPSKKYPFPTFLDGRCSEAAYLRWLGRKAIAHVRRDRTRGNSIATREAYMVAIHSAVTASRGNDAYTGAPLAWELISTYNNSGRRPDVAFTSGRSRICRPWITSATAPVRRTL